MRTTSPPTVGAIIGIKPQVQGVVELPPPLFERPWVLSAGGRLKGCHIAMTEPYRGKACIVSVSFSDRCEIEAGTEGAPS
jgi:hypothetical protein